MSNDLSYKIERRNVKYPRLELKTGNLVVIAPKEPDFDVENFIDRHILWIRKKLAFIEQIRLKYKHLQTQKRSVKELKKIAGGSIADAQKLLDREPNRVTFRKMKTKWGSCSSKRNLTFNTLLRYLPQDLIDYVVYHEMCHLRHLNHNRYFWHHVEKKFPSPKEKEEQLFGYWFLIDHQK